MTATACCADMVMQGQTRWRTPLSYPPLSPALLHALASSLLAGDAALEPAVARLTHTLGRSWRWLRSLVSIYLKTFATHTRPTHGEVVLFLRNSRVLQRAWQRHHRKLSVRHWLTEPQQMQPAPSCSGWTIPAIQSPQALADWLLVDLSELEWYADLKGLERHRTSLRLRHYHYHLTAKSSGGIRVVEAPKVRLKQLQRRILFEILQHVPPHSAVHGFVPGHSIKTFAAPHTSQPVILRLDLKDFFPSIRAARVQALLRTAGYPETVADFLTGLCTNATPRDVLKAIASTNDRVPPTDVYDIYARPHLPQGAPTSPTLANLCAYHMDCRLAGLAQSIGAVYTRYADDLAFSGGTLVHHPERFATHVAAIVHDEGFRIHHRKTRIMRQGVRQHLAGLVVNRHPNIRRDDYDRLKAILTNCIRLGPESQNRESHPRFRQHLQGRIEFVRMVNPARANRLQSLIRQIAWPEHPEL